MLKKLEEVLENIILAQTIGFSFCQEMSLTPFHNFITHLNIPDCQGKESLFQAEMNRCYQYLQELQSLNQVVIKEKLKSRASLF